jgi:hypothetical protein
MVGFSDNYENKMLDHLFGGATYSQVATLWIGLSTADPLDTAAGLAEPSGSNYSRVAVVNSSNNFNAASGGVKRNVSTIAFPTASGSWGLVGWVTVWDNPTSTGLGAFVGVGSIATARNIISGDAPIIGVGSLTLQLD